MDINVKSDNQQLSSNRNILESSETIPNGSTQEIVEAVPALPDNAGGNDIVQKSKAFLKYIDKANQMFDSKFDYSKFVYVNAKTRGIINCPIHGEYYQSMDKHTAKNSNGCPKCWMDNKPFPFWLGGKENIPFLVFKEKADKTFPSLYEYDESSYSGLTQKMLITCKEHGVVEVLPTNFLKSKIGCPNCGVIMSRISKTKSYFDFILRANQVHFEKYKYPEIDTLYKNRKSIIKIECPVHGVFLKRANKHLSGHGCSDCRKNLLRDSNIFVGGYSFDFFEEKQHLKNIPATLYLLKINNFYKIGITTKSTMHRIKSLRSNAKHFGEILNIEILATKQNSLFNCFVEEQLILDENKQFRIFKKWSTELLSRIDMEKYF
jgi:hypothetical protein